MTQIVYYAAASLDGFIAGPSGELDWLHAFESPQDDYGYAAFLREVDGLVMGRRTFDALRRLGNWPYGERPAWVLSHRPRSCSAPPGWAADVRGTDAPPAQLRDTWQSLGLRRVWLVGGGAVARLFAQAGLLDEIVVTTVPVLLGQGRPLFAPGDFEPRRWPLRSARVLRNGLTQSGYAGPGSALPATQAVHATPAPA